MIKRSGTVVLGVAVISVLLMAGLVAAGSFDPKPSDPDTQYVGTWYVVTSYTADATSGSIYVEGHSKGDGSMELTILRVGDGMFTGLLDGNHIQGGLSDGAITFSHYYPSIGFIQQFEGVFLDSDVLYGVSMSYRWGEDCSVGTVMMSRGDGLITVDTPGFPDMGDGASGIYNSLYDLNGGCTDLGSFDLRFTATNGGLMLAEAVSGDISFPVYMVILGTDSDGCYYGNVTYYADGSRYVGDFSVSNGKLVFRTETFKRAIQNVCTAGFSVDHHGGSDHGSPEVSEGYAVHMSMVDGAEVVTHDDYGLDLKVMVGSSTAVVFVDSVGGESVWTMLITPLSDGAYVSMIIFADDQEYAYLSGVMGSDGSMELYGSGSSRNGMHCTLTPAVG